MEWKSHFPALQNQGLIYCDSAATTHKPQSVIDAITRFYSSAYAPIGRGLYTSGEQATRKYEAAREAVANFFGAERFDSIVFTKNATEGINMVAWGWATGILQPGDEIVVSQLEHHSHWLVWQRVAQQCNVTIRYIPVHNSGMLDCSRLEDIITSATKIVAISAQSNVVGMATPLATVTKRARASDAYIVVDASQYAPRHRHMLQHHDWDFCVWSAHKMLGPTGLGVLYVAPRHHKHFGPYQYGGGMVYTTTPSVYWREMPYRCEAGSPPSAQVVGYHAALTFLQECDMQALRQHEIALCAYVVEKICTIPGVHIIGDPERIIKEGHLVSFYHDSVSAHDIAMYLDTWHMCVRSGHHCCQPLHAALGIRSSVRVSFYGYNTHDDAQQVVLALQQLLS